MSSGELPIPAFEIRPINSVFQQPKLPYARRRPAPKTYKEFIWSSVEAYKDIKFIADWWFDIAGMQPSVARPLRLMGPTHGEHADDPDGLIAKRKKYQWQLSDNYPPHILSVPDPEGSFSIFGTIPILETLGITGIDPFGTKTLMPQNVDSMSDLEVFNKKEHKDAQDWFFNSMFTEGNIGLRDDWYTDRVFAQQQFIGVNPTTITSATSKWIGEFVTAATNQGNDAMVQLITSSSPDDFYVQDCSSYRTILNNPTGEITSSFGPTPETSQPRYGGASVTLFHLPASGRLHPLGIVLDYKGSVDPSVSVTVFNKRLSPDDSNVDQRSDWPWRYAKMCASSSDWTRHEVTVHLTQTHFIEEAIIVAGQRNFPGDSKPTKNSPKPHILFELLSPHWITTLSLNALGRQTLVEGMIAPIAPFTLPQILKLTHDSYYSFDFVGKYVPSDLAGRGIPIDKLDTPKFHNFAYARDIHSMWVVLRKFISNVLTAYYTGGDAQVAEDRYLAEFCAEMQAEDGANLKQFPTVTTLEGLIDMITMCIHIAAPQHTAINYLQQFYLTFIPNRPASLYAPLPKNLEEYNAINEEEILAALPLHVSMNWLLMAQVPYLLSSEVETEDNIVTYAKNAAKSKNQLISAAGKILQTDIAELTRVFHKNSLDMDDQGTPYSVLDPDQMATAIVI